MPIIQFYIYNLKSMKKLNCNNLDMLIFKICLFW